MRREAVAQERAQRTHNSDKSSEGRNSGHARGPSKDELKDGFKKMLRLEWITLFYQVGAAALVFSLMGGSQAMKTEWMENALAVVPVVGVLLTYRTENKSQDARRPFGYHRAGTIAFVAAAFTLAGVGTYLFYDALTKLLRHEYPSIGGFTLFGHTFWHGWLMMGVMFLTAIPPVVLGRMKIPVAVLLHDKALFADADMNRANWMSNGAGLIGLGLMASGFWWGDSLAAMIISLDIMKDGWTSVARSLSDVMDHHPTDLETNRQDSIVVDMHRALRALPFVDDVRILVREHGRYLYAEVFIAPNDKMPPAVQAGGVVRQTIMPLDWRLQHVAVEFTDHMEEDSRVLTREELDIETG